MRRSSCGYFRKSGLARLAGIALILALSLGSGSALAQDETTPAPVGPETQEIGLLFTETAERGSLKPVDGERRFALKLRPVSGQVVWFSDRPARRSGQIPIREFVRSWAGFGFAEDPPNAALTLLDAADDADTVVLELGKPRYKMRTNALTYPARLLGEASGNLSHFEHQRDSRVPRRFREASLFIDDASAPVINGCVIQPFTHCPGANLNNANLSRADLSGADLSGANLNNADLSGATLTDAYLEDADFTRATLAGVDLSGADVDFALLVGADLSGADLSGAHFSVAKLQDANLQGVNASGTVFAFANLGGANFPVADRKGAIFCRTTMPDSSTNNADCSR